MAVDGKKASGRLASAAVFWLLVAIFANQNCVHCEGEEDQQRTQQLQQDAQLQQQQLQLQQQQLQQQQDQQQRPLQQQQLPLPLPPSLPPPQQQPQQLGSMIGPLNRIENELQPGLKDMTETTMNSDFGGSNLQQQLRNGAGQLNMPGDGRGPMFSGSLPTITGSQQSPTMQTDGSPRAPNFAETNLPQGINSNTPSMQTNLSPSGQNARKPLLQINKQTINPQPLSNNQPNLLNNPQNPLNNPQNSLNNMPNPAHNQYSPQMQQRPGLASLPHLSRFPSNRYIPGRLPMDQQAQRPYLAPYYPNGNAENGYEVQGQTLSNAPVYPDQSASSLNLGDLLQQPVNMFSSMMPSNAMQFVQKPIGMLFTTADKLGRYTQGVKQGLDTAFKGVVDKIFKETESGAKKAFELGSNGTSSLINFGRRLLVPETLRNQDNSGGGYLMQQNMQHQNYPYNPYASSPNYGGMGYNNMQHHTGAGQYAGQYAGGSNNGQLPMQHTGSQMNAEYGSQDENMQNPVMAYPVNPLQPIVHYGQPN